MSAGVPCSIEVLRQQARDELAAIILQRCRHGEDPWHFIPDLPSVDEQVVQSLRAHAIDDFDLGNERARAHHPAAGRARYEQFEYDVLRRIALDYPELTPVAWAVFERTARA